MHKHFTDGRLSGSYLEGVDVESPHWARVPVALSDGHVTLSSHDLRRVVEDDVAVLTACDKDTRRVPCVFHPMGSPHQFVVSGMR